MTGLFEPSLAALGGILSGLSFQASWYSSSQSNLNPLMSHTIKQLNVDETINEWLQSKKYRKIDLTEETMRDVLIRELSCQPDAGRAATIARRKLHHIAAAYLGDPDYEVAEQQIADAVASDDALAILDVCRSIAGQHATVRERL